MANLPPESRPGLLERLASRSERLAKMAQLDAPDQIIAMMTEHVIRTAMTICGGEIQQAWQAFLTEKLREHSGLCAYCAKPKEPEMPMCQPCWDEMETMDQQVQMEEADENNPH